MRRASTWYSWLLLIALGIIWGYNWIVIKLALRDSGPLFFAAARTVLGAGTLFLAVLASGRSLRPGPLLPLLGLGLLQTTGFIGFSVLSLVVGHAGETVLLAYTMPFWALLFARWWLSERLSPRQWMAVGGALAGLILVLAPWNTVHAQQSDLYALCAALCWAASVIVIKKMRVAPGELLSVTAWQMLFGSGPLVLLACFGHEAVHWTPYLAGALAYNAVFGGAIAWLLWLHVVRTLSAAGASFGILLVPVIGIVAAALQLHEYPSSLELVGIVLICGALGLLAASATRDAEG